ncbi:hypothetical protein NC796_18950 [Aliifodinibius sp. S!AR15-10]|uniref:hypothetical protein n=1 Tax=Aliifodinibius sp. S!AR15-10 TaxID=2950437 RepID=UPI00285CB578|nr:hypothetical protein [Aliifodinibius sp. S!AR15-10]MDR8393241.1 hypothetical protein [Aliifodinibius sp. S!AR15-10]
MKRKYKHIKIELETPTLSARDLQDLQRWEDEGGHLTEYPDLLASISSGLPLHKKEIFEVVESDLVIENGKLYLQADLNILSHH